MTSKQELIARTRRDLEAFNCLPIDEQVRQMIAWGTLDENGEVMLVDGEGEEKANVR